jgi:Fur family ferric uptake transcriptional regulator
MKSQTETEEVACIRDLLRAVGLRSTTARIAVMQQLRGSESPLTHADLAETLVPLGFDKATVYRNLIDLADAGLVKRTELGDHLWRFEFRDPRDPQEAEHPHFVCVECGSVTCLPEFDIGPKRRRHWAQIGTVTEILLKGRCKECN